MDEQTPLPRWLCAVFVIMMLVVVAELAWFATSQYQLRFQVGDVALSLDTSRQREAKQQYEYDQAIVALPLAQEELATTQPLADEAKAREQDLRSLRKSLRAQAQELTGQLEAAQAQQAELEAQADALRTQVEELRQQQQDLQAQIDALLTPIH